MYISHMRDEDAACWKRWTNSSPSPGRPEIRAEIYHLKASGRANWWKMDTVHRPGRSGAAEPGSASRLTCTPIRPVRPGSTRPCRPGSRRAGMRPGCGGSATPRSGPGSSGRCTATAVRQLPDQLGRRHRGPPGRLQAGFPQVPPGEDARGGRHDAGHLPRRDGHRPRGAGRQPGELRLLHHVGGQRPQAGRPALGELRLRWRVVFRRKACFSGRAHTPGPTETSPGCSAAMSGTSTWSTLQEAVRRLTSLPASNLRIQRRGSLRPGILRRRGGVRSGTIQDNATVRTAAPVRHRHGRCLREWSAGAGKRRAHGRAARAGWCGGRGSEVTAGNGR